MSFAVPANRGREAGRQPEAVITPGEGLECQRAYGYFRVLKGCLTVITSVTAFTYGTSVTVLDCRKGAKYSSVMKALRRLGCLCEVTGTTLFLGCESATNITTRSLTPHGTLASVRRPFAHGLTRAYFRDRPQCPAV